MLGTDLVEDERPEIGVDQGFARLAGRHNSRCLPYLFLPVVGLCHQLEVWGVLRVADSHHVDNHAEQPRALVGSLIQPIDRGAVFKPEAGGHPNDRRWFGAGRIGDDLAEVRVVGQLQLVLDNDDLAGRLVISDEVQAEATNRLLGAFEDQIHTDQVTEHVYVLQ